MLFRCGIFREVEFMYKSRKLEGKRKQGAWQFEELRAFFTFHN